MTAILTFLVGLALGVLGDRIIGKLLKRAEKEVEKI